MGYESADYDAMDPPSAFRAKKLVDGRVLVEDVPVFAEVEARYTPDGKLYAPSIGLPWLRGAFAAFQRNPNYWAPLHGDHHTGGALEGVKDRERFGEFRARSVRLMRVEGKPTWVFTADYLFDDEEKAKKSNRFPYQSVEIVNEKPDEINSVALLSDKAPFVRFPNRRVAFEANGRRVCYATAPGRSAHVQKAYTFGASEMAPETDYGSVRSPTSTEVKSPTSTSTKADTRGNVTVTGGAGRGATTSVTINHEQDPQAEPEEYALNPEIKPASGTGSTKDLVDEVEGLEPAPADPSAVGEPINRETPTDRRTISLEDTAAFAAEEDYVADEKKPDDTPIEAAAAPVAAPAPASDSDTRFAALEKGMGEIREMVAKLSSSMSMNAAAGEGDPIHEERKEGGPKLTLNPGAREGEFEEKKPVRAPVVAAQVQLAAEVDTLKARLEGMERAQKRDELYVGYAARLEPFGLTTGVKQRLESFLANDLEHGTTFAEQYVKDYAARAQRVSRPATERGPGALDQVSGDLPAELRSYAAEGPASLAWAQARLAEFRALEAHGCAGDMTLAAFFKQGAESAPRS